MSTKLLAREVAHVGERQELPGRLPIEVREAVERARRAPEPDWRLSEEVRTRGRKGVAEARKALKEAIRRSV